MSNILQDIKFDLIQPDATLEPKADKYHCYLCEYDFDIADCDEHEEGPTEIYNKLNEVFCRGEDNGH